MTAARTILELLSAGGRMGGLALVKTSDGRLKRGVIYVRLGELEDAGYVRSFAESETDPRIGIPRRAYEITSAGRAALLRDDL